MANPDSAPTSAEPLVWRLPLHGRPLTPLQAPAWRLAHPAAFAWVAAVGLGGLVWWAPSAVAVWGLLATSLLQESRWRRAARQAGCTARWVIPSSRRWWNRRLVRLGLPSVPAGAALWEIHVQDDYRWRADTPAAAARPFRVAYGRDMAYWLRTRPPHVAVAGSTFNRLTPDEAALIRAAGGQIAPGAVHPRLPRSMTPAAYRRLQIRLFGGVVSTTPRHDPARWTTWVVPPLACEPRGGSRRR